MAEMLIEQAVATAALATVVAFVCRFVRPRPAVAHALWLVVLAKLVVPPAGHWPAAFLPDMDAVVIARFASDAHTADLRAGPLDIEIVPVSGKVASGVAALSPSLVPGSARPLRSRPVSVGYAVSTGALFLWLAGSLCSVFVHVHQLLRCRASLGKRRPAPAWLRREVGELAATLGIRAPSVTFVAGRASPYVWALGLRALVLPEGLLGRLDRAQWRAVAAHELAHIKRRDAWFGLLECVAGCLWWWNPVFWWTRRNLRRQAELACDAWAVWALSGVRKTYAQTLVRVVELSAGSSGHAVAPAMSQAARRAFEDRLTRILRDAVRPGIPWRSWIGLALLAALAAPGWSQDNAVPAPEPFTPSASAAESVSSEPAVTPEPAAPDVAAESVAPESAPVAPQDLKTILSAKVSIKFRDMYIARALDYLSATYGLNIVLDARAVAPDPDMPNVVGAQPVAGNNKAGRAKTWVTDGVVRFAKLDDVPLYEALTAILRPLDLVFAASPHVVWVTSPALLAADEEKTMPPSCTDDAEIMRALGEPVTVTFQGAHIVDVVDQLSELQHLNIMLDNRAAPAAGSENGSGGRVRYARVSGAPLAEVLDLILRSVNLAFTPENGYLWVSTHETLDKDLERHVGVESKPLGGIAGPSSLPLKVLAISDANGQRRAQIQTRLGRKWYGVGERFERYTIMEIDPRIQIVTIRCDGDSALWLLNVEP